MFPAGRMIGVKAIPTALKNATTQPVQPKVSNPNMNVKKGIALLPVGSDLFKLKFTIEKVTIIEDKIAIITLTDMCIPTILTPKVSIISV